VTDKRYLIKWHPSVQKVNSRTPTQDEIDDALAEVKKLALATGGNGVMSIFMRREVAAIIAQGINEYDEDTVAECDIGEGATYSKDKGYYQSILYVARDKVRMENYIDTF
jgi:hypothetical protein